MESHNKGYFQKKDEKGRSVTASKDVQVKFHAVSGCRRLDMLSREKRQSLSVSVPINIYPEDKIGYEPYLFCHVSSPHRFLKVTDKRKRCGFLFNT